MKSVPCLTSSLLETPFPIDVKCRNKRSPKPYLELSSRSRRRWARSSAEAAIPVAARSSAEAPVPVPGRSVTEAPYLREILSRGEICSM